MSSVKCVDLNCIVRYKVYSTTGYRKVKYIVICVYNYISKKIMENVCIPRHIPFLHVYSTS